MRAKIALALLTVYVVWGSTYLAIRWVVAELPPLPAGGARFVVAGAAFVLVAWAAGARRPSAVELRNAALIGAAMPGLSNGLVSLAARSVPSGLIALVLAIMPLWVALLEAVRPGGARPGLRASIGLVIGFAGTATLVWHGPGEAPVSPVGLALLVTASFVWAVGSLFARSAPRPQPWMTSAGIEMLCGGLFQLLLGLLAGEIPALFARAPSPRALGSLVYLVVIGAWMGYGAFSWLTRNARPALVATYGYVNPLVAVALGSLLADEPLGPRTAVAAALIVGSVILVTTARR